MHNRYSFRPARTIVYASIAQEKAWGCEYPLGDPWGGPAFGEFNKGGFFSSGYWSGGGIVNSVTEFFSDPVGYTGERLKELDKTVLQPVGHTLEAIGKSIEKDPLTFVATVVAAVYAPYLIPVIQGASVAAHGGSFEDVLKTVAISAATVYIGGQLGEAVTGGLEAGSVVLESGKEVTQYAILGTEISAATAQTIGNVVGYSTAAAAGAAASGKNSDQILTAAVTGGVSAAIPYVVNQVPGFSALASGNVGLPADVSKAIANGLTSVAGAVVTSAIAKTDISTAVASSLIASSIRGLASTQNVLTDMFKAGASAIGMDNLSSSTQAVVANTLANVFGTALTGGNAGSALQQAMMSVGTQALANIGTELPKTIDKVNQLIGSTNQTKLTFDEWAEKTRTNLETRNDVADQINDVVAKESVLSQQYTALDNQLDQFLAKNQGYQEQQEAKFALYEQRLATTKALEAKLASLTPNINSLVKQTNDAADSVNAAVKEQQKSIDAYNAAYATVDKLRATYNAAIAKDPVVATDKVLGAETYNGAVTYLPPGTQVAYGANGAYAYKTVGPEGYIRFDNATFGDPIEGTYKYGYAITYGGYTGAELEAMKNDITSKATNLQTLADTANYWGGVASDRSNVFNEVNGRYTAALTSFNAVKAEYESSIATTTATGTEVNNISALIDQTNKSISDLVGQMQSINGQATELNNQYTSLKTSLDNYDTIIKSSEQTLLELKTKYESDSALLDNAGASLQGELDKLTSNIALSFTKTLDPNFNAEQYKQINNLGNEVDAVSHWLAVGKNEGLYTNQAAVQGEIDTTRSALIKSFFDHEGYSFGAIKPEAAADLGQKLDGMFGNDIKAWRNATVESVLQESGLRIQDFIPETRSAIFGTPEQQLKRLIDASIAPGWYKPDSKTFSMPAGYAFASQEDVAASGNGKTQVYSVVDKTGNTVYLKKDENYKPVVQYNATTGNMDAKVTASALNDMITLQSMDGVERTKYLAAMTAATSKALDMTYVTENFAKGANVAKSLLESINASDTPTWAKNAAASMVTGLGNVIGFAGTAAKDLGYFSDGLSSVYKFVTGSSLQSDARDLEAYGDGISKIATALKPEDFKADAQKIQSLITDAKTAQDSTYAWYTAMKDYGAEVATGMAVTEFSEELVQQGVAGGAQGVTWATAAAMGVEGASWLAAKVGVAVSVAGNMLESYKGNRDETYNRLYPILINQGYTPEQAELEARKAAAVSGLTAAGTTGVVEGVLGHSLTNAIFGNTLDKAATSAADLIFQKLAVTPVKVALTEAIAGAPEGALQAAATEYQIWKYDPSKANFGANMTAGALWESTLSGPVAGATAGVYGAGQLALSAAVMGNQSFLDAVHGTNGNMSNLGTVLSTWMPESTGYGVNIKDTVLPMVFSYDTSFADNYSNAQDFMDAVRDDLGVWQVNIQADIAKTAFADQVVSTQDAIAALNKAGVSAPTANQIVALTGVSTQAAAETKANYITQITQMYTDAVGRAPDAYTLKKYTDEAYMGIPIALIQDGIKTSYDYLVPKLTSLYKTNLGRSPTTKELTLGVNAIQSGALTLDQATNMTMPTYQALVNKISYVQNLLAAGASTLDPNALQSALQMLRDAGMSQSQIQTIVDTSAATETQAYKTALDSLVAGNTNGLIELQKQFSTATSNILGKVTEYMNQGYSQDQALQAALDTVAHNLNVSSSELMSAIGMSSSEIKNLITTTAGQTGSQIGAVGDTLAAKIAANEAAGMARDAATQAAIDSVSNQLGLTRTELLNKIDITSQQFTNQIEIAKTDLTKQIATTGAAASAELAATKAQILAEMARGNVSLNDAINNVSINLGLTRAEILTQLGVTEQQLATQIDTVEAALSSDIEAVSQLVGKPTSQVTANDIKAVQNIISGQTAANLAYDINQDQVIDVKDLQAIQTQLDIQNNPNIVEQVDQTTGQTILVDKTTGQQVSSWNPAVGTQWAPTGVYAEQAKNAEAAATAAKTAAATAKTNQQKNQFTQMMQMVLGAPDAAGRKVTVETPDPAKINYIYDWNSIFANPQQAGLMPSPYGAVNTYGQPMQQPGGLGSLQTGMGAPAANQSSYKMAIGGFAEGGMIGGDISVGDGGSVDDLLNILKGNSG